MNNIFHRNTKDDPWDIRNPLNVRQMEWILSRISCYAGMAGFSAVVFALGMWNCLLWFLYGNSYVMIVTKGQVLAFVSAGVISCLLLWLMKGRLQRLVKVSVSAYPNAAAHYYGQRKKIFLIKIVLYFAACVLGYVLSVIFPYCFQYSDLQSMLAICAAVIVNSTFNAVSLLCERRICAEITVRCVPDPDNNDDFDVRAERIKGIFRWSVYWSAVLAGYVAISAVFQSLFMYWIYFVLGFANFLLRVMNNNPFRRFSSIRAKRITVRMLNVASTLFLAGFCIYIIENGSDYNNKYIESLDYSRFQHDSSVEYDSGTGVYTLRGTAEEFRILQLTDIHICGSITTIETDRRALTACYDLIMETQPNLIVITGDLVYPIPIQTFSKDNLGAVAQLCDLMEHIGIPWIFVYGNHDTETAASYRAEELLGLYRYYVQQAEHALLYADKQPDIYGRYNQYIRILNADGGLNRILFLMDSNDYTRDAGTGKEYDSVHRDQILWYEDTVDRISREEGRTVPSFIFMHIPFQAFAEAQDALKDGSEDAVYLFGENGEGVSCSGKDFGFFDAIVKKESTQAVFVGHDHLNNLAVKYKGVDLVYSKSIDYYAYPGIADKTEQRGATLITLFTDGTYCMEQIDYHK